MTGVPPVTIQTPYTGSEVIMLATRTERIEIRTDPEREARITQAARLQQTSVSAFVLDAATAEADRVLARTDQTVMPSAQFDDLMATLDEPDDAPVLAQLAARPRRFSRS
jgi:uncharacterized protein (DUF1778 family)